MKKKRFQTLDDYDVFRKVVLVRADLNVPMQNGVITDMTRIERFAPTLYELSSKGAKVVILSHFGRPKNGRDESQSLGPVGNALEGVLGQPVGFVVDCIGPTVLHAISDMTPGQILLLENTRFYPEEEQNDPTFAAQLAALGQLYVNDAFSAAHRAHASTEGLAHHLPTMAGRLMQAELEALEKTLGEAQHPVMAICGGSKISTKLALLNNLVSRVDILVLGGGMANTFLAANGVNIGRSLCEHDMLGQAREIQKRAKEVGCQIYLPGDAVVAEKLEAGQKVQTVPINAIPADQMVLDIGPGSIKAIMKALDDCPTLLWNGPLGAFEVSPFDTATTSIAKNVAERTKTKKLLSVAGGGDTVAALAKAGVAKNALTYVSTAGGAFLEWLEGKELPGVAALFLNR